MSNSIYSAGFQFTLAAAGNTSRQFEINANARRMKIMSITINWKFKNQTTNLVTPDSSPNNQHFYLRVGDVNTQVTKPFLITVGAFTFAGNVFELYRSGQWQFNSFFIANRLPFILSVANNDAQTFDHWVTIIVETEERIIY